MFKEFHEYERKLKKLENHKVILEQNYLIYFVIL